MQVFGITDFYFLSIYIMYIMVVKVLLLGGYMLRTAIYCRVSTEEQAKEGFSIAAQKKTLLQFCEQKGWSVTNIYTDEGISGKNTNRPSFLKMLKDAASGGFQVILVWKINRFSRRNSDLLNTVEHLREYGVNLVSYSEQFDASTPSGKLMLSMLGSIGEFERDTIVENIQAGMKERAEQGLFNGGRILGYDMSGGRLIINKGEASTVKRIFNLYLAGNGYSSICRILEEENRTTKNGCQFQINSVKRILKNSIYAGYITYNKTSKLINKVIKNDSFICIPGNHDKIISKSKFQRVQEIMNSKKQSYISHNNYILTPILICPFCGGKMTGHTGNRKKDGTFYRYYICRNYKSNGADICNPWSINADNIENEIIDSICSLLLSKNIPDDIYKHIRITHDCKNTVNYNELDNLKKDLAQKKRTLERYTYLFENSSLNLQLFEQRVADLNSAASLLDKRMETINNQIQSCDFTISYERVQSLIKDFKPLFSQLGSIDKKRILSSAIKHININPDKLTTDIVYNFNF